MTLRPTSAVEVQEAVLGHSQILPRGGGSKSALSTPSQGQTVLEMSGLSGVLEYNPSEYVFVARGGTRLAEVEAMLSQNGQYLPFDPPFVQQGATLGGTVAAGLSGPMRHRYGGVRDFILGVQFVDGYGNLVRGGGKVVKNAAGFDLPKLMVGSCGQLGVLTELAFKVFPFPKTTATLRVAFPSLQAALEALYRLAGSPIELYALDIEPPSSLVLRLGGLAEALPGRLERLQSFLAAGGELLQGQAEADYWRSLNDLSTLGEGHLIRVALTARHIPALDKALGPAPRRYMSAGNLLYLVWNSALATLDALLEAQGLSGLVLNSPSPQRQIGINLGHVFGQRVTAALDPQRKFSQYPPDERDRLPGLTH